MNLRKTDQFLVLGYFVFAVAYLATMHLGHWPGNFVLKSLPILLMSVMVVIQVKGWTGRFLFAGFIFSAAGDIALTFVKPGNDQFFIMGLACFFAAHLMYVLTFTRSMKLHRHRIALIVAILVFSAVMAYLLATHEPGLGSLLMPVMAYICVIAAMGVTACFRNDVASGLITGALLFMLSDSCIAVSKFLLPPDSLLQSYLPYGIMITYYAGQYFIGRSFIPYNTT
jgi:uncharacterized membrane protein YhhN